MQPRQFSRTAWGVAAHRAAHQILEDGSIFRDPFAHTILGPDADAIIAQHSPPERPTLRLFVAMRARFAEDNLAAAYARGLRQTVVLGAGLDTFALRNPFPDLMVFEVDHPATQAFKRNCLAQAGLTLPANARFAPVDFEYESLSDGLAAVGFCADKSAFFIWLGVVPYLTREAIVATLDFAAAVPQSEIVFDYSEPLENYSPTMRPGVEALAARAASLGEPWLSHFDPMVLAMLLEDRGFGEIEDLGPREIASRYLGTDIPRGTVGGHVVRAASRPSLKLGE